MAVVSCVFGCGGSMVGIGEGTTRCNVCGALSLSVSQSPGKPEWSTLDWSTMPKPSGDYLAKRDLYAKHAPPKLVKPMTRRARFRRANVKPETLEAVDRLVAAALDGEA